MKLIILILLINVMYITCWKSTYKAIVVEHEVYTDSWDWDKIVSKNIEQYKIHAKNAGKLNGDIMVYPEFGLYGSPSIVFPSRDSVVQVSTEAFPDVNTSSFYNPCKKSKNNGTLKTFSCLAMENNIYVVVNAYDKQLCPPNYSKCHDDGFLILNTDLVFNKNGEYIAKYYKMHPWFASVIDEPITKKWVTFNTTMDVEFGLMICYDILWDDAVKYVDNGIRHFPYAVAQGSWGRDWIIKPFSENHNVTILNANLGLDVGDIIVGGKDIGKRVKSGKGYLWYGDVQK